MRRVLRHPLASMFVWLLCVAMGLACDSGDEDPHFPFLQVENLEILRSEHNELSCFVSWSTREYAASRVEFGESSEYTFFLEDDELTAEHEILLFGMRPSTTYHYQAVSVTEDGEELRSEDATFVTGALPFPTLATEVTHHDEELTEPGWTLTNLSLGEGIQQVAAVIFDEQGEVVWYYEMPGEQGRADVEVTLVENDRVLIGGAIVTGRRPVEVDLSGEILWAGPKQTGSEIEIGGMHHTFQKLPNGDYITMFFDFHHGLVDVIEEFDPSLHSIWTWNTYDYLPDSETEYPQGNALHVDLSENVLYYNAHVEGTLYKVDRDDGHVLWALGNDRDFEIDSDDEDDWFLRTHAPEIRPGGGVLFYDNGTSERGFSRVVEYDLDEEEMLATLVWEYPGDLVEDDWYNRIWGEADRLPNGNTLITAGSAQEGDAQGRIFEVRADGTKVWEMWLGSTEPDEVAGSYSAERIPVLYGLL